MVLGVLPMECRLSFRKLRWASCRRSIYVICFRRVSKPITQKLQSSFTPGAPFAARVNTVLTPSHWAWHLRKRPRNPLAAKWAPCSTFLTGTFCAEGMPQFGQRVRLMKELNLRQVLARPTPLLTLWLSLPKQPAPSCPGMVPPVCIEPKLPVFVDMQLFEAPRFRATRVQVSLSTSRYFTSCVPLRLVVQASWWWAQHIQACI